MTYEFYKVLHIVSLICMTGCLGINFFSGTPRKWARIGSMIASFLLMVAGMGLLAKTKLGWPTWVIAKMAIWILVAISAPIMAKRINDKKEFAFSGVLVLLSIAIILAVIKP
ncbi:MAG: hypothetical protein HN576_07710 [Bacteriovoracaceae bacterium]|jgi:uncharacterized membrane protein SirB2|nr:hypothetical protein [Bacteriovoracaceae bacterium]